MNYALSQRRTDRHPVGLMIVVGLHVLLAAAILTAKLKAPDTPPVIIDLHPVEQAKPVEKKSEDLPRPAEHPLIIRTVVPDIEVDHPPDAPLAVKSDDKVVDKQEPTLVASIGNKVVPEHFLTTPHRGVLNASALQCHPDYPAAAQRAGATGTTRIRFSVDASGRILGAQILQSSGSSHENRMLDQAAAAALAKCPVTLGTDDQGRPAPFTTDVDYVWALN